MHESNRYSSKFREPAMQLVFGHQVEHDLQWAAMSSVAGKIGCTAESLRKWMRQAKRDQG